MPELLITPPLAHHLGFDLDHLGKYVDTKVGDNLFTHNLQANIRYQF